MTRTLSLPLTTLLLLLRPAASTKPTIALPVRTYVHRWVYVRYLCRQASVFGVACRSRAFGHSEEKQQRGHESLHLLFSVASAYVTRGRTRHDFSLCLRSTLPKRHTRAAERKESAPRGSINYGRLLGRCLLDVYTLTGGPAARVSLPAARWPRSRRVKDAFYAGVESPRR